MVAHSQIISVALLHHRCSLESLEKLYRALKDRFAYFEIVLLNPVLAPSEQKLDSSALDSCIDCHATAGAVSRNDSKKVDSRNEARNLSQPAQNSRSLTQNATILNTPQAAAVEMRNRGFQGAGEGIYLSGNEQARAAESTIYRSKPATAVQGEAEAGFFRNATPTNFLPPPPRY